MRLPGSLRLAACTLALAAIPALAAHATDYALVVGCNTYINLPHANLEGCVNDAQAMGEAFKKYGFSVTMLKDGEVTRNNIVATLRKIAQVSNKHDRFVFYFAGHGSQLTGGNSVLLMSDSTEAGGDNDMPPDILCNTIKGIPARSRTVILDSCFSGGMMRGIRTHSQLSHLKTRFYPRGGADKSLQRVKAEEGDTDNKVPPKSQSGICYFTAAMNNEQAGEDDFNGSRHGVFTYFISAKLTGQKELWGEVETSVRGAVAEHMEGMQHPRLGEGYQTVALFDSKDNNSPEPDPEPHPQPHPHPEPQPKPHKHNLWDTYNSDFRDESKMVLNFKPNRTPMPVNSHLYFTVDVAEDGYLVILEKFNDKVRVLYPAENEKLEISGGANQRIPGPKEAFSPDEPGTEFVKAILFKNKEDAQKLLGSFDKDAEGERSASWDGLSRSLHRVQVSDKPFFTSDVSFEVRPKEEIEP